MIKVLYIPTGTFINYYIYSERVSIDVTPLLDVVKREQHILSPTIENILTFFTSSQREGCLLFTRNNIQSPCYKEEFEVTYD